MPRALTDYEAFESASEQNKRLHRQEEFILDTTLALLHVMEEKGMTKAELSRRLGKSKGFVSQVLSGGRNLTFRTFCDLAGALNCRVRLELTPDSISAPVEAPVPIAKYERRNVSFEPGRHPQIRQTTRVPVLPVTTYAGAA